MHFDIPSPNFVYNKSIDHVADHCLVFYFLLSFSNKFLSSIVFFIFSGRNISISTRNFNNKYVRYRVAPLFYVMFIICLLSIHFFTHCRIRNKLFNGLHLNQPQKRLFEFYLYFLLLFLLIRYLPCCSPYHILR